MARQRRALPASAFALPRERKYPLYVVDPRTHTVIPSASHARNAKARAAQQFALGNVSLAQYQRIVRKADGVLRKCGGRGRTTLGAALRKAST